MPAVACAADHAASLLLPARAGDLTLRVTVCGSRFDQLGLDQCTIDTSDPKKEQTLTFTVRARRADRRGRNKTITRLG